MQVILRGSAKPSSDMDKRLEEAFAKLLIQHLTVLLRQCDIIVALATTSGG